MADITAKTYVYALDCDTSHMSKQPKQVTLYCVRELHLEVEPSELRLKTPRSTYSRIKERFGEDLVSLAVIEPSSYDQHKIVENLSSDLNLTKENANEILSIFIAILKLFFESSDKEFNNQLNEYGFSTDFVKDLPLISNRTEVTSTILSSLKNSYWKLSLLKWKVDISLYNSALEKKLPVSVIFSISFKDGRKYVIEVDHKTFHKLRFNVALLVKELNIVKSNFVANT